MKASHFASTLSALALASAPALADVAGRVVGVHDGDTVTVVDAQFRQHKVRLAGIDAPERGQAYGSSARLSLAECAFSRWVRVDGEKLDRYGRLVGRVLSDRGDCNLVQIQRGMAWHYKAYEREQSASERHIYAGAELQARRERAGLWRAVTPQAPWEFRRAQRE